MPIREYICPDGHVHEKVYLTFAEDEKAAKNENFSFNQPRCPECSLKTKRVEFSMTGQPILLGEGFYKPSPSGNTQAKRGDPTQAVKDFIGEAGGGKNIVKQMLGGKR